MGQRLMCIFVRKHAGRQEGVVGWAVDGGFYLLEEFTPLLFLFVLAQGKFLFTQLILK